MSTLINSHTGPVLLLASAFIPNTRPEPPGSRVRYGDAAPIHRILATSVPIFPMKGGATPSGGEAGSSPPWSIGPDQLTGRMVVMSHGHRPMPTYVNRSRQPYDGLRPGTRRPTGPSWSRAGVRNAWEGGAASSLGLCQPWGSAMPSLGGWSHRFPGRDRPFSHDDGPQAPGVPASREDARQTTGEQRAEANVVARPSGTRVFDWPEDVPAAYYATKEEPHRRVEHAAESGASRTASHWPGCRLPRPSGPAPVTERLSSRHPDLSLALVFVAATAVQGDMEAGEGFSQLRAAVC